MSILLSQSIADELYQAVVSGYDAADTQGRGKDFLSKLVILLVAEVAIPERVVELIALANHHSARTNSEREASS